MLYLFDFYHSIFSGMRILIIFIPENVLPVLLRKLKARLSGELPTRK